MSEALRREQFAEHIKSKFYVPTDDVSSIELELAECNDLGTTARQEQFSLLFAGPLNVFMQQSIYPLRHETLGELSLFLVPVKRDNEHFYYEAIFNYFREEGEAKGGE